jgi:hypothetical protein
MIFKVLWFKRGAMFVTAINLSILSNIDFYEHCRLRCGAGPRAIVVLIFKGGISRIMLGLIIY